MDRNEFFPALPVTRLTLRLIGGTLEICTDDIQDIHVMVSGDNAAVSSLRIATSADQLIVEQPAAAAAKSAAACPWMQVTIRLPRSWKGNIDAHTVSGWINARGLSGADLSLETVSSMVSASDMTFITMTVRSVTGDVKISSVSCEKCSVASSSGAVQVQANALRTAAMNSVMGNITLQTQEPFDELTLNSVMGQLRVEAPIDLCDGLLRSVSGRIRTSGVSIVEDAPRIRATTVSGDLDIIRNDI